MFQIVFNKISAAEMARLPQDLQLDLLSEFEVMPEDLDNPHHSPRSAQEHDPRLSLSHEIADGRR